MTTDIKPTWVNPAWKHGSYDPRATREAGPHKQDGGRELTDQELLAKHKRQRGYTVDEHAMARWDPATGEWVRGVWQDVPPELEPETHEIQASLRPAGKIYPDEHDASCTCFKCTMTRMRAEMPEQDKCCSEDVGADRCCECCDEPPYDEVLAAALELGAELRKQDPLEVGYGETWEPTTESSEISVGSGYVIKDSGQREDFKTGMVRDVRHGKGRYDLISPIALRTLALILEGGAVKYSDRNWEKGMPLCRFFDSAVRHLFQWMQGLDDEDHLGHAFWNIHCILHLRETHPELDDRPRDADEE